MPWARRKDSNSKAIEQALIAAGWTVVDTSRLPSFVDLVVAKRGRLELLEIKVEKGAYKPAQVKLHADLLRAGVLVKTLRSIEDAVRL
jgi:hypothetical protein